MLDLQNMVERWRTDVAIRQAEVRVVQEIEELRAKLKLLSLRDTDVLEGGEVPIEVSGPLRYVAASRSELLHRRVRVGGDALERVRVEPGIGSFWSIVRILSWNQAWPVCGESADFRCAALLGEIHRIKNREGGTAHHRRDTAQLPAAEDLLVPAMR